MPPENEQTWDFGGNQQPFGQATPAGVQRAQIQYPLDAESFGALKVALQRVLPELSHSQAINIPSGATTFEVRGDVMVVTADVGVTIATITGGYDGRIITLVFTDANVTITDTGTGVNNTVNLSAAFTSTAEDVLQLVFTNRSWREVTRSTN